MELNKLSHISNTIACDIEKSIMKNLQQFDKEISAVDVAICLAMSSTLVLSRMYELGMDKAMNLFRVATRGLSVVNKE